MASRGLAGAASENCTESPPHGLPGLAVRMHDAPSFFGFVLSGAASPKDEVGRAGTAAARRATTTEALADEAVAVEGVAEEVEDEAAPALIPISM